MTVESYEAGISQQYQAIEAALQNVANLKVQLDKRLQFEADNQSIEIE